MMSISCAWTTLWAEALAISCDSHVKDQMPEKWQGVASFLLEWLGWSMVNCLDWISSGSVMNFHPSSLKVLIFSSWFYWRTPQIDEIEQRAEISGSGQTSCLGLFSIRMSQPKIEGWGFCRYIVFHEGMAILFFHVNDFAELHFFEVR